MFWLMCAFGDEDKKTLERAKCYVNEKNRFDEVDIEYSSILTGIQSLKDTIDGYVGDGDSDVTYENIKILEPLNNERRNYLGSLSGQIEILISSHAESHKKVEAFREEWKVIRDDFEKKYKEAKEKSSSSKATLNEIVYARKKQYPGHAKRVMMGVWSFLRQFMYTKFILVTDDDVNARDWQDVIWALTTRVDPIRDTTLIDNTPIDYLDFALPVSGLGSKMGIDATHKLPSETQRDGGRVIEMNEQVKSRIDAIWHDLNI